MRYYLNKYILLILTFYAFYLIALPAMFSNIAPILSENISYNSHYNVIIEKPKLVLNIVPKAIVKSKRIIIHSKSENITLNLENFSADIRLLPLLTGKLHINSINADDIYFKMGLKRSFLIDKNLISKFNKSNIKCDSVKIQKLDILIKQPKIENTIVYKGKNIYYKKNARYLNLSIDSELSTRNQISEIKAKLFLPKNNNVNKSNIDIDITNLDISPFCESLKDYIPSDIKTIKGVINVDVDKKHMNINFNNFAIHMKDAVKSVIFPAQFSVQSNIVLTSDFIAFENMNIFSENISMNLSGKISNYMDKRLPLINLKLNINKSKLQNIIPMLPAFKTEDIDAYKLKKYGFNGNIIGSLNIKGNIKEPSVLGDIYINDGILIKPIKNADGATVKLKFTGKYLNFDVYVPAGNSQKVWVKGGVELYNVKYSDMHIWSTKKVDLETAQSKVVPLHEILNFIIGPVPIMDIKGLGNIDIIIKGNRKKPHVWGVFNVFDTKTKFLGIPDLLLTDADAVLEFDDEHSKFTLQKGLINGKPTKIDGTCTLAGKFDFDVSSDNQDIEYFYNAIKTSTIIDDIKKIIPDLENINGKSNIKLKVYGNIKDIYQLSFNRNFFVKGAIELLGNTFNLNGIKINDTKGCLNFDGTNVATDITAKIGKSTLTADGSIKQGQADIAINIPRLNLIYIFPHRDEIINNLANLIVDVSAKYKGRSNEIEYDKLNFYAKILDCQNNNLRVSNGTVILKDDKLQINKLNGKFSEQGGSFDIDIEVNKISKNPILTGKLNLKDFDLSLINKLADSPVLPQNLNNELKKIHFNKGKINLFASVRNNNINASTNLGGINFTYVPLNLPVQIVNGSVYSKKDKIDFNKINILADNIPLLIDGKINNIFTKKDFDLYINSKLQQEFIDKYINNHRIYPIKIKGNIASNLRLKGTKNNYNVDSVVNLEKDSSIYYMGTTVGDLENDIAMHLDMQIINQNILKIREFSYDKIISSLSTRKTKLNMLQVEGGIDVLKDDIIFHDLRIKTNKPTDARIFNIIFRKPNIKQGQFISNLKLNGKLSNPVVLGSFHIFETNIPFLDTTMKNINFLFKENFIEISSVGEILGNDINIKGTLKNKLTQPYYVENAYLKTKVLDLNRITNKLRQAQIEEVSSFNSFENFNINNLVIKNLKLSADEIILRNISAQNVEASSSLSEQGILNINDFSFKTSNGFLKGNYLYNLNNNHTNLYFKATDIDANDITYALFNLKNQIYGNLTGEVKLACDGENFERCMNTLNGKTTFDVTNGKMPKLGSLEYLLKAGNLVKGGITGISVNSVIDILTPLKTGDFSSIYGLINIKDGVAEDIEISTKGNTLSLFITGNYNFSNSIADMEVFGLLTKNIVTLFGPLGNVSLNTLFNVIRGVDLSKDSTILDKINKIPGIEFSNKDFRKFIAIIKGNINSDDYVSSFKWIN